LQTRNQVGWWSGGVVRVGNLVGISARGIRRAKIIEFAEASFVLNILTCARTDGVVVTVNINLGV